MVVSGAVRRQGLRYLQVRPRLAQGDVVQVSPALRPEHRPAAIEELRKSSGLKAAKKAGRTAAEGASLIKISDDNTVAFILEVNSETDFVARDDNFLNFANDVLNVVSITMKRLIPSMPSE